MTIVTATAQDIIDRAPLGSIIRFSDGTPQPPARFKRKLSAWRSRNGTGRLTGKRGPHDGHQGDFLLHLGDWDSKGVIIMTFSRHYTADSRGSFTVEQVPQPGEALVLTDFMGAPELQHVACNEAAARAWLEAHRHSNARIEIVAAPEPMASAA